MGSNGVGGLEEVVGGGDLGLILPPQLRSLIIGVGFQGHRFHSQDHEQGFQLVTDFNVLIICFEKQGCQNFKNLLNFWQKC